MQKLLNLCTTLLFLTLADNVYAGDWIKDEVSYKDGRYHLNIQVVLDAPYAKVYTLLTDYGNLTKLNKAIIESKVIDTSANKQTIKVTTKDCVTFFCFKIINVQSVTEPKTGHIIAETLPELSNLKYGRMEWDITPKGNQTLVSLIDDVEPDFPTPPIIGPVIVKARMKANSESSIRMIEEIAKAK